MADVKFSALSAMAALGGTEKLVGLQGGAALVGTPAQINTYIRSLMGTGVSTALNTNVGSAGAPVLFNGAGGTPSSLALANATGLVPSTGLTAAINLAASGAGGVTGTLPQLINPQTGTTYVAVAGDDKKIVTLSNGATVAVTQPQATGSFATGWAVTYLNLGAGVATITPTTSTWNGAASVAIAQGEAVTFVSNGTDFIGAHYAPPLTLTTTGSSGPATLAAGVLNIPEYTGGGGGSATPGIIVGCQPIWTSGTQLSIGSGQIYIESTDTIIPVAAQTITPTTPSNNTWYHGYVNSSGTFSVATTAPVAFATPCGFARSKSGDTASRYVGSFRTNGSGNFYKFNVTQAGLWHWIGSSVGSIDATPFRVLAAGTANTSTNIDASAVIPVTSRMAYLNALCVASDFGYAVGPGDVAVSATAFSLQCQPKDDAIGLTSFPTNVYGFCDCDASQTFNYIGASTGSNAFIDVHGFYLQR